MPDMVKVLSGRKETVEECAALRARLGEDPAAGCPNSAVGSVRHDQAASTHSCASARLAGTWPTFRPSTGPCSTEREERDRKTTDIEKVDKDRYTNNQSVTCSMYRPARKDDPVAAANANPTIAGLVRRIAREEGIDENQFLALVYQESRFNPCAKSGAGAIGLAQLMPGTASDLGVNPYNIEQNLRGGARYYKQQLRRFNGNVSLALAAYNSGPGNVQKYGGIPPFQRNARLRRQHHPEMAAGLRRLGQVAAFRSTMAVASAAYDGHARQHH